MSSLTLCRLRYHLIQRRKSSIPSVVHLFQHTNIQLLMLSRLTGLSAGFCCRWTESMLRPGPCAKLVGQSANLHNINSTATVSHGLCTSTRQQHGSSASRALVFVEVYQVAWETVSKKRSSATRRRSADTSCESRNFQFCTPSPPLCTPYRFLYLLELYHNRPNKMLEQMQRCEGPFAVTSKLLRSSRMACCPTAAPRSADVTSWPS